jgi:DNA-binding LacI/PurR family transcriptional regulator
MPTVIDVAKRAGVSVSTVSYALNGTRPISEETRQRILQAVEELGYKPHALARGLASKRSRILALLFPTSERGLGVTEFEFVTSAANAARANEYSLMLWSYDMHDLDELRQLTRQGLVDGVVVMEVHETDERIAMLRETNFPFSMIGRCANAPGISFVDIDFKQTVRDAIDYLTGLGHTHIAMNERAVPGVLHAIANQGWSVPDDFSLMVIVSSARMAEMMLPALTAMEAMTGEMGRLGVELLIQQLEGQVEETQQVLLPCRLVVRGSSGLCRGDSNGTGR